MSLISPMSRSIASLLWSRAKKANRYSRCQLCFFALVKYHLRAVKFLAEKPMAGFGVILDQLVPEEPTLGLSPQS